MFTGYTSFGPVPNVPRLILDSVLPLTAIYSIRSPAINITPGAFLLGLGFDNTSAFSTEIVVDVVYNGDVNLVELTLLRRLYVVRPKRSLNIL